MKTRTLEHARNSVAKKLFLGQVEEGRLFPFPKLSAEEREILSILLDSLKKLGEKIDSKAIEKAGEVPPAIIKELAQLGIFGMVIPQEYGGSGLSMTAYCRVTEILAGIDSAVTLTVGAHQSIGLKAILLFGNEEQKKKYLPALASGEKLAAYSLTEPVAGSDARSIQSKAVLNEEKTHYILNGQKMYVTNGRLASVYTVFAKTPVDENGEIKEKVSAFIMEREWPGITIGRDEEKMGIKGSVTNPLFLENVKIPVENRIGLPSDGFKIAMEVLNEGRLSLGAGSVGGCKRLIALAAERAKERKAFRHPIGDFEMVKQKLYEMTVLTYAAESVVYFTAGLVDSGMEDFAVEAAMAKIFGSETLWTVSNHAMQIFGGDGFLGDYPIERMVRDSRINIIFEGTNEILRGVVTLMGAREAGEELKKSGMMKIGMEQLFGYRVKLERVALSLAKEAQTFEQTLSSFKIIIDRLLLKYGKGLAEHEHHQARIANAAIDLYACLAVLSRVSTGIQEKGEATMTDEINIAKAFIYDAGQRIGTNLHAIQENQDELVNQIADKTMERGRSPSIPL